MAGRSQAEINAAVDEAQAEIDAHSKQGPALPIPAAPQPARRLPFNLATYATGNAVPGGLSPVDRVSQAMAERVQRMAEAMPPEIRQKFQIISGYRSPERQAQVNPGVTNSRHSHGMALDLGNDPAVLGWVSQNGPQFGLGFPLAADPKERNHLEMLDARGTRAPIDYSAVGDTGFKSGLRNKQSIEGTGAFGIAPVNLPPLDAPTAPAPARPGVDPAVLAALASQSGLLGGGDGLSNIIAKATQATQTPQTPTSIVTDPMTQTSVGSPLPISRRLL